MNITERFLSFIKPERETKKESPPGSCPICRNYQQYDVELREVSRNKRIGVANHWESYMLIQDLVKEHLGGIKLEERERGSSPSCSCKDLKKKNEEAH